MLQFRITKCKNKYDPNVLTLDPGNGGPIVGEVKCNVDVATFLKQSILNIGMCFLYGQGQFIRVKTMVLDPLNL